MNKLEPTQFTNTRRELEARWRLRLAETKARHQAASAQHRNMLNTRLPGQTPNSDSSLSLARAADSQARGEYARVLEIFTNVIMHGKVPEEYPTAGSESV